MAFDLNAFAADFGIDPETLKSKSDSYTKWNGYMGEVDTKYQTATKAQKEAQAALDAVKAEQAAIDDKIKSFSLTEAQVDTLKANYAALEAQAKALKTAGYDLKIPDSPASNTPPPFDPNRFQQDVNNTLAAGFNVVNKYQRVFGKALPDNITTLAQEAAAHRLPFEQYAEQKYGFAAEEKRQSDEKLQKEREAYAAQKVKEYQDAHPVTAGNPELVRGGTSRFPEIGNRPAAKPRENFGGTPAQRIARSVKRSMEGLSTVQ